jgi:hypothetical protein
MTDLLGDTDVFVDHLRGSRAIPFVNAGFLPLVYRNEVAISAAVKKANGSRSAREQIWLYHGYPRAVRIDRVKIREATLDVAEHSVERETFSGDYSPDEILGFSELPPGQSREAPDLTDLAPIAPSAVRYVELEGRTSDGRLARGTFTLLPP